MHPPASAEILPIPVQPPALRVLYLVTVRRVEPDAPCTGARPYTLRAHAQARWRRAAGWA